MDKAQRIAKLTLYIQELKEKLSEAECSEDEDAIYRFEVLEMKLQCALEDLDKELGR
jgi:hypothetical protein